MKKILLGVAALLVLSSCGYSINAEDYQSQLPEGSYDLKEYYDNKNSYILYTNAKGQRCKVKVDYVGASEEKSVIPATNKCSDW
jgi:hypothetical protein